MLLCVGGGGYVNDNRHGGGGCRWGVRGRGLFVWGGCSVLWGRGGLHCECVEAAVDYGYGACYEG